MGVVYEALHQHLHVSYAIKVLHPTLTQDWIMVERLRREAMVAFQLQHQNIVQVLDYGWDEQLGFYLIMELLRGVGLHTALVKQHVLPLSRMASIVYQVCDALNLAHSHGVIHRDLKPGNIFLVRDLDDREQVKLLDFGIARLLSPEVQSDLTRAGKSFGTPEYMPPEQILSRSDQICPATDIYSLASVIFRAVTGELPFKAKSLVHLLNQVIIQPAPLISTIRSRLRNTYLERLLAHCMAKSADSRPSSVAEFIEAFRMAMQDDPLIKDVLEDEMLEQLAAETDHTASTETDDFDTIGLSPEHLTYSSIENAEPTFISGGETFSFGGETFSFDGKELVSIADNQATHVQSFASVYEQHRSELEQRTAAIDDIIGLDQTQDLSNHPQINMPVSLPQAPKNRALSFAELLGDSAGDDPTLLKHRDDNISQLQQWHELGLGPESDDLTRPLLVLTGQRPTLKAPPGDRPLLRPPTASIKPHPIVQKPQRTPPPRPPTKIVHKIEQNQQHQVSAINKLSMLRIIGLRLGGGFLLGFMAIGFLLWLMHQRSLQADGDFTDNTPSIIKDNTPQKRPAIKASYYYLRIESNPSGARVIEQGRLLGSTPLTVRRRAEHSLYFVLEKSGYELSVGSWEAKQDDKITFTLRPR
jgi:serine/threonine protein kinase